MEAGALRVFGMKTEERGRLMRSDGEIEIERAVQSGERGHGAASRRVCLAR